jgi:flagellar protein FlgJ
MLPGAPIASVVSSPGLASDPTSLASLKARAAKDPKGAAREVATLFDSLFLQEMLKRMRAASLDGSPDDGDGGKLGTEMLDGQLAQQLAGKPGGLGDLVARQLERLAGAQADPAAPAAAPAPAAAAAAPGRPAPDVQAEFVRKHGAAAQAAAARTGIAPSFILAQAAHETGWGRHGIVGVDGTPSNNLFGIKAGAGWNGPSVDVATTEYRDGKPIRVVQRFRAYASEAESFADYARLVGSSPRYAAARAAGGDAQQFALNLQRAGYATDPAYAEKLGRTINATLQLQRAQA